MTALEEKARLLESIDEKTRKRNEERMKRGDPPKTVPADSAAANTVCYGVFVLPAIIGFAIMAAVAAKERPATILPLMAIGIMMAAGLGIFGRAVFRGDQKLYERTAVRWFTSAGLWTALALGAGAILAVFAALISSR